MKGAMELTASTILVAFAGVFLICFMKGAFGGGLSIVGIPLLSIVMDPVTAGGLLAPCSSRWICSPALLEALDVVEAGPSLLLPGLVIGIGFGYLVFRFLEHRAIAIVMAAITLIFVGLWLVGGAEASSVRVRRRRRSPLVSPRQITTAGALGRTAACDVLLFRGLNKEVYAGTTSLSSTAATRPRRGPGYCW